MTTENQITDKIEIDVAPKLSLFHEFFEIRFDFESSKQSDVDIKISVIITEFLQYRLT